MAEILEYIEILDAEYDCKLISDAEYGRRLDELLNMIEEVRK